MDDDIFSVDINADGKYVVAGEGPEETTIYFFDNSISSPKVADWSYPEASHSVAISALGDYFVAGGETISYDNYVHLFHHYVPIPTFLLGDDDDDDKAPAISFGNYYLIFAVLAMLSLIVIMKRKITFKNK